MMDCKKMKGPCTPSGMTPEEPPKKRPPPFQFPWTYTYVLLAFFSLMGLLYKFYVWSEEQEKVAENKPVWRPRRKIKRPYHDRDLPPCVQYLIIGTGAAAWAAYQAIQQYDKKAKVFFITKEDMCPYQRPPMSKQMWLNQEPPDIKRLFYRDEDKLKTMLNVYCEDFMDPVEFYRKKSGPAVSFASGWCVLRVDPDEHVVYIKTMCGEKPMYYERCLIATGSKPKNLECFKSGPKFVRDRVCLLRTIRDLELSYRKVAEAKHVTIIGGGPLGCELAWYLGRSNKVIEKREKPIEFVHVFKDKGILSGILPQYLGEWAAEFIKCEGVTIMPNTQVYDAFESKDGRLQLTLSNGKSIVTDYAFVAIGNEARTDFAETSYLELDKVNGGFLVNTELEARTHLYIAGDCASFYAQWKDARMRIEHYINAEEQGYIAGANMCGYWVPCNIEPNFFVKLGDHLNMEVVGEVGACMPIVGLFKQCDDEDSVNEVEIMAGGDLEHRKCYQNKDVEYINRYKRGLLFYLRDDVVVGFVFWNLPAIDDRKAVATELLRAHPTVDDISVLAEILGFPGARCTYPRSKEGVQITKEPEKKPCISNVKSW